MVASRRVAVKINGIQVGSAIVNEDGMLDMVMGYRMASVIEIYSLLDQGRVESLSLSVNLFEQPDKIPVEENAEKLIGKRTKPRLANG